MPKKRLKIKFIQDSRRRHGNFNDRRRALFRETDDFCNDIPGTRAAVIVFSEAGNLFEFGNPNVHEVVNRCFAAPSEAPSLTEAAAMRLGEALRTGQPASAWDEIVKGLGLQELGELEAAAEMIKSAVDEELEEALEAAGGRFPARWDVS